MADRIPYTDDRIRSRSVKPLPPISPGTTNPDGRIPRDPSIPRGTQTPTVKPEKPTTPGLPRERPIVPQLPGRKTRPVMPGFGAAARRKLKEMGDKSNG